MELRHIAIALVLVLIVAAVVGCVVRPSAPEGFQGGVFHACIIESVDRGRVKLPLLSPTFVVVEYGRDPTAADSDFWFTVPTESKASAEAFALELVPPGSAYVLWKDKTLPASVQEVLDAEALLAKSVAGGRLFKGVTGGQRPGLGMASAPAPRRT